VEDIQRRCELDPTDRHPARAQACIGQAQGNAVHRFPRRQSGHSGHCLCRDWVYAGIGDPNVACCFVGSGLGEFRSPDGRATWAATGLNANQTGCQNGAIGQGVVNRMIVIPGRPAVVFAATNMGLFSYKEDGRDCWTKLTLGLPVSGNAIDFVVDPYQGALYVAFSSQGIFKSTDLTGVQWKALGGCLPTSGFGRIALAFGGRRGLGFSQPRSFTPASMPMGLTGCLSPRMAAIAGANCHHLRATGSSASTTSSR